MNAAIYFQSDGYVLEGRQIMGRRMAGAAFLRAAVEGREGEGLHCFAPLEASGNNFRAAVQAIDPSAETTWIPAHRLERLAERRMLYHPDNAMADQAWLRLRASPGAYGICGVTHTICTHKAMDGLARLVSAPVMSWDALICTSLAARNVVENIVEAEADYERWMGRAEFRPGRLQLPVIPLGVHTKDFAASPDRRAQARARLELEADEVAFLFAGRLSYSGKAHPYQMQSALQAVAEQTGQRIALIQAGQFSEGRDEGYYRDAPKDVCPDVRIVLVDGADFDLYGESFAAADGFISLADSIQESFGLTPIEAMAAGLPVVVSDWDGYRDTVRDGVDGFRIRSWAPAPGTGAHMAMAYECGLTGYELFQSRTSTTVSLDMAQLVERLVALVRDPALRRKMGEAGQVRARADYDWAHIYRRYRALWAELDAIRLRALADPDTAAWLATAPRAQPARPDPHSAFAQYPTSHISGHTLVTLVPGIDVTNYATLIANFGFRFWKAPVDLVGKLFDLLAAGPRPIAALAPQVGMAPSLTIELVARLAKMNLVALETQHP